MAGENIIEEFKLKTFDETKNYLIEEINQNNLMDKNHKSVCTAVNYIEVLLF